MAVRGDHLGRARTIVGARVEGHDDELLACEPVLLDLARRRDLRGLRRAAGHFRNLARGDGSPPGTHDGLCASRTDDRRLVLDGECTDLAAETIATAIHAYTDPPGAESGWALEVDHRASASGRRHRAIPHAAVVIDWATLTTGRLGRCDGEFTGPIHRRDVERMLCDCEVSRVVTGPDGLPLDAGRSRRTVPPGTEVLA